MMTSRPSDQRGEQFDADAIVRLRQQLRRVSALSSTWAWISTPGMADDTGVVLMSFSPTAEVPISTSLPLILSGGTLSVEHVGAET